VCRVSPTTFVRCTRMRHPWHHQSELRARCHNSRDDLIRMTLLVQLVKHTYDHIDRLLTRNRRKEELKEESSNAKSQSELPHCSSLSVPRFPDMASNTPKKLLWASLLLNLAINTLCFQVNHNRLISNLVTSRTWTSAVQSKLFGDEAYDDEFIGEDSKSVEEGQTLAKSFYEEMRKRNNGQEASGIESTSTVDNSNTSGQQNPRRLIEDSEDVTEKESQQTKFTGRSSPTPQKFMNPSERFPSSISSSGPGVRTPREMMMEQEYQLVGRAEKGLAIQGVFTALALAFCIYIGLSGGISNRSEESLDFGGDDMLPFEQLAPVQKDRETSVWL
jgi:hypothetical protein